MQETQNSELFSDLSSEESCTLNGGHYYHNSYSYSRSVPYYRRPVSYHYRSYKYHNIRPVRYSYQSYYNCY
ncbi:MAG: hypothetical protein MGF17_09115 [Trichodesmium sp. MAG_R04]|nr:hypothetical protein [Trichodesmium sp. MAG_R04]